MIPRLQKLLRLSWLAWRLVPYAGTKWLSPRESFYVCFYASVAFIPIFLICFSLILLWLACAAILGITSIAVSPFYILIGFIVIVIFSLLLGVSMGSVSAAESFLAMLLKRKK